MKKKKPYYGLKVLVLDGNGRQAETIIQQLYKLGCEITTLNYSRLDVGNASRYPKHKIVEPKAENDKDYLKQVIEREIKSQKYDVLMPLLEASSVIIAENYSDYSNYVKITMPSPDGFWKCYNKQKTFEICQQNNLPCPQTRMDGENIDDFLERVGFPIAMKPRSGIGSKGFHKASSKSDFLSIVDKYDIDIDNYVIQEYVDNSTYQYNTYIFIDDKKEVKTAVVAELSRPYPPNVGGTPGFFRSVNRPDILDVAIKLLQLMDYRGFASVCFIASDDDHIPKVMEINGRISASIRITDYCGCNISLQHIQRALGEEVYCYGFNKIENRKVKHSHTNLLWIIKSKDRFKVRPSIFNFWKTRDMVFRIGDPWPFFSYGIQGLLRYKKTMKEKKR